MAMEDFFKVFGILDSIDKILRKPIKTQLTWILQLS